MDQTRQVTMARHGVVSAPHYLASQAGTRLMMAGGNAVDAALAANAVLNVVYPFVNGTGGDIFVLLYDKKSDGLYAFNGSGRAPAKRGIQPLQAQRTSATPQRRAGKRRDSTLQGPNLQQCDIDSAHDPVG